MQCRYIFSRYSLRADIVGLDINLVLTKPTESTSVAYQISLAKRNSSLIYCKYTLIYSISMPLGWATTYSETTGEGLDTGLTRLHDEPGQIEPKIALEQKFLASHVRNQRLCKMTLMSMSADSTEEVKIYGAHLRTCSWNLHLYSTWSVL